MTPCARGSGLPVPEPFFDGIEGFELERAAVWPVLTDCRATKSSGEVAILRYACAVASRAHVAAMRAAAPGRYEFQLEALYLQVHSIGATPCGNAMLCTTGQLSSAASPSAWNCRETTC